MELTEILALASEHGAETFTKQDAASFVGKAIEWRELETGEIKCMAFVPASESIPTPRCTHTAELF